MSIKFPNVPTLLGAFFFGYLAPTTLAEVIPPIDSIEEAPAAVEAEKPAFTFLAYNLKNWLTMSRYVDGKRTRSGKPEDERNAIINTILVDEPDILGICEIGSAEDLEQFAAQLKEAGLDYPHIEHAHGADSHRTLALLSKYPFSKTDSQSELGYMLNDELWVISRGILDATVETPLGEFRFLGVHLKSKREIPEADQAQIRLNEAMLLRQRVVEILRKDEATRLVVYGDVNDTRKSEAVREIIGRRNSRLGLEIIDAKDDRGTTWTHHWAYQDIYSRLDWIFVSRETMKFITEEKSRLLYEPEWRIASDHRAIYLPFFSNKE